MKGIFIDTVEKINIIAHNNMTHVEIPQSLNFPCTAVSHKQSGVKFPKGQGQV